MTQPEQAIPVVVIDDERDIRDACQRILTRAGCEVSTASNAAEGLAQVDERRPWVVLLDLKMPGPGGLDTLPRIRQRHPEILVIIITGYATVETAIEAMKRGAYDFIPKPFKPDELRLTVGRAIERRSLADEAARLERERARTLADLHLEQSRTRTILESLPFGVMVTTPDDRVALANPAAADLLGREQGLEPGRPLSAYIDDPELVAMAHAISAPGDPSDDPEEWSREFSPVPDRCLLARGSRVLGEGGQRLGAVLVLADMTAYKLLDRLKNEFVAKVSHELRSPLSTILMQLTVLAMDGRDPASDQGRQMLSRAKQRTQSLIDFVKELLDISRIESGTAWHEEKEIALEEVLNNTVDSLSTLAEGRGHTLALHLPDEPLPPLLADPTALASIFNNLVANAINYSDDGGVITVTAEQNNGELKVAVSDTGFGIEADKLDRIFENFYRVKNEKTLYVTGTGLGLPIVKSVAEGLGGRVEVASTLGQGSTFTVYLPPAAAK